MHKLKKMSLVQSKRMSEYHVLSRVRVRRMSSAVRAGSAKGREAGWDK